MSNFASRLGSQKLSATQRMWKVDPNTLRPEPIKDDRDAITLMFAATEPEQTPLPRSTPSAFTRVSFEQPILGEIEPYENNKDFARKVAIIGIVGMWALSYLFDSN